MTKLRSLNEDNPIVGDVPRTKWEWEARIKKGAWRTSGLTATDQHVLLALATFANGSGMNASPGSKRLEEATGRSPATVAKSLSALRNAGWIHQVAKGSKIGNRNSEYRLTLPQDSA